MMMNTDAPWPLDEVFHKKKLSIKLLKAHSKAWKTDSGIEMFYLEEKKCNTGNII